MAADARVDDLIDAAVNELHEIGHFRYLHKIYDEPLSFLQKEPYVSFLQGCRAVVLGVMTLGGEVDKAVKRHARADMERAVVLSAAASAYLEHLSDTYEQRFGEQRTYRFCPGYGGSSVTDLPQLFAAVRPEKIGVTLSPSCFILPEKSMAGIVGVGKTAQKSCDGCIVQPHCVFRKEGNRCYSSAKK